jgi:MtN3 and saliva related transmembrane protein
MEVSEGLVRGAGYLAGFCTTVCFIPQVRKAWISRSTRDISGWMYGLFLIGVLLWLAYGVMRRDWAIIIANAVTAILAGSVIWVKWRHRASR